MRMPPLPADSIHARACKLKCEKILTRPRQLVRAEGLYSNDAYRKVIWQCNHKFDGQKCATPTLTEDEIKELFLRAANQVIDQKEQFIAIYDQVLSRSLDTTALESELPDLEAEINIAAELIEVGITDSSFRNPKYCRRFRLFHYKFLKKCFLSIEVKDDTFLGTHLRVADFVPQFSYLNHPDATRWFF